MRLAAAVDCREWVWLHGHIHRPFALPATSAVPFPVVCVGSTTQNNRWSYHEYTLADGRVDCVRRAYDPAADAFRDAEFFQLTLPAGGH